MAKEVAITKADLVSEGGDNKINIVSHDPTDPNSYKEAFVNYDDLSAGEKTQLDDCLAMLESKLP